VISPPRSAWTSKSGALLILALLLSRGGEAHADWMSIGPAGGVVTALAIDPSNSGTMYAGTSTAGIAAQGGSVFKSADGGETWRATGTGLPNRTVQAFAIDPATPSTVYAVTDGGVFKSQDGGVSWEAAGFAGTFTYAWSVAIDPTSAGTVYVGAETVFKSTDAGATWSAASTGLPFFTSVRALAIDPTAPSTMYAATSDGGFKSTDGGANWNTMNVGLPDTIIYERLAIDPTNPSTLYAQTYDTVLDWYGGVFKSTDAGATWNAANGGLPGDKVQALAIDPTAPSTVYVGLYNEGVFKSTDGGTAWGAMNDGLSNLFTPALAIDHATGTVFVGTGLGVFKSTDGAASWRAANSGLRSTGVSLLAATRGAVYAVTGVGFLSKSTGSAEDWRSVGLDNRIVTALAIAPTSPLTLYAGGTVAFAAYPELHRSTDGVRSWKFLVVPSPSRGTVLALAVDPSNALTVYAATSYGVEKSTDGGETWSGFGSGLDGPGTALAIAPTSRQTLYATGYLRGAFKSSDGGASWSATSLPAEAEGAALAIDPTDAAWVYAGTQLGVFRTTDGSVWSLSLPSVQVHALAIDPTVPSTVYAATNSGVFKSPDRGETWSAMNAGLPNMDVVSLAVAPSTGLYAGTYGRGVFETSLPRATAGSVLKSYLESRPCTTSKVPAGIERNFRRAAHLIDDRVATIPPEQAHRMLARAKKLLKRAKANAIRAGKGRKPSLSIQCAAGLGAAADLVVDGLEM